MKRRLQLATGAYVLAVAAALGFGVVQAAPLQAFAKAPPCTDWYCNDYCTGRGYSSGVCNTTTLRCECR